MCDVYMCVGGGRLNYVACVSYLKIVRVGVRTFEMRYIKMSRASAPCSLGYWYIACCNYGIGRMKNEPPRNIRECVPSFYDRKLIPFIVFLLHLLVNLLYLNCFFSLDLVNNCIPCVKC